MRVGSPRDLYKEDTIYIRRQLNKFSNLYIIYPEFDNTERLHYHGIITITDNVKFHKTNYLLGKLGFTKWIKIKSNKENLRSTIYSMKDWALNRHIFDKPILYKKNVRKTKSLPDAIDLGYFNIYIKPIKSERIRTK